MEYQAIGHAIIIEIITHIKYSPDNSENISNPHIGNIPISVNICFIFSRRKQMNLFDVLKENLRVRSFIMLLYEIMNSISPITSLAGVISRYFKKKDDGKPTPLNSIDNQIVSKTLSGLSTIEETGKGLLDFVD